QLPFLQFMYDGKIKIVPIVISLQVPEISQDIAMAIHKAVEDLNRDAVLIATSDWTHYEPYEVAYRKDMEAIDRVLSIDPEGLFRVIEEKKVSACGYGAIAVLLYLAKMRGIRRAELLKYATSGDIAGRRDSVVGYASIRVPILEGG
ncbi:MAG TPA: AmmeMemoRadiSam system protein B, partial [Ignisphaera sp.]|nr:AmmeMemoRadiSam system protein B [Ignisphaera sp.]